MGNSRERINELPINQSRCIVCYAHWWFFSLIRIWNLIELILSSFHMYQTTKRECLSYFYWLPIASFWISCWTAWKKEVSFFSHHVINIYMRCTFIFFLSFLFKSFFMYVDVCALCFFFALFQWIDRWEKIKENAQHWTRRNWTMNEWGLIICCLLHIISHFLDKRLEETIRNLFVVVTRSFSVLSQCRPNQIVERRVFLSFSLLILFLLFLLRPITQLNVHETGRERAGTNTYTRMRTFVERRVNRTGQTDHQRWNNCSCSIG